jgi:hypothetical protein
MRPKKKMDRRKKKLVGEMAGWVGPAGSVLFFFKPFPFYFLVCLITFSF